MSVRASIITFSHLPIRTIGGLRRHWPFVRVPSSQPQTMCIFHRKLQEITFIWRLLCNTFVTHSNKPKPNHCSSAHCHCASLYLRRRLITSPKMGAIIGAAFQELASSSGPMLEFSLPGRSVALSALSNALRTDGTCLWGTATAFASS